MLTSIVHKFYKNALMSINTKTGNYQPEAAPRSYLWEQNDSPDPFTLESHITRNEKKGIQDRPWLHTSILDQAAFHNCIRSLSNNKAPGSDVVVNEILTMLPPAMRQTIHLLFIFMRATGITPKAWKTSETVLIENGKGEETDLSSYRPVGLANTLCKLWTRMVTNTL